MTIHRFTPTHYHGTFGSHEPVLTIADGDSVMTTTVDAWGYDAHGQRQASVTNPQTGPFYIEGAEPGDTLAVHFDRVDPHRERETALGGTTLQPMTVDPGYVPELPLQSPRLEWRLNHADRTVTMVRIDTSLGEVTFPMEPMVGSFGVAPEDDQAITTFTSGTHGGNMDYRGFRQGVTAYLPVFVPGALFHLGDGHALQGDGEIAGMGIETPLEVQFTVRLLKGKTIYWPRGEDDEFIFTAGNARPLDQALQHATTEMSRWLQEDYNLDPVGVGALMGLWVRYEVGNVYDPAYTMICKMPKHVL